MIDPKYSLKYSFPHSVVHIVDNSMYTGETVIPQVQDPSVFSTIVVTGLPMGEDNRFISISRSDVLNTGFGINTLTTSDVTKYSQAVEYPMALLQQNVPVKLMRVTPDDATYSVAVIMVQWKKTEEITDNKFEVRFKTITEDAIRTVFSDLNEYKNVSRLNKALITRFNNRTDDDSVCDFILVNSAPADWSTSYSHYYTYDRATRTYEKVKEAATAPEFVANTYYQKKVVWNQRVFMTVISAGRGSAYNRMRFFINKTTQTKRQQVAYYNFGTIDTLNGLTVENFAAALINNSNNAINITDKTSGATSTIDTVNISVAKRVEGSSVLVPTVNENAVQEVFDAYMAYFKSKKETNDTEYASYGAAYDWIYGMLNSSMFDILYGQFAYKDSTFKLPYYQVDMYDTEVPKLPENHLVMIRKGAASDVSGDHPDNPNYNSVGLVCETMAGYGGKEISQTLTIDDSVATTNAVFDSFIKQAIGQTFNDNNAPAPGDLYLSGVNNKNPYLTLVTSVNLKNGYVTTMPFTKVKIPTSSGYTEDTTMISRAFAGISPLLVDGINDTTSAEFIRKLNAVGGNFTIGEVIAVSGISNGDANSYTQFNLYLITGVGEDGSITGIRVYPKNLYAAIDFSSNYLGEDGVNAQICRKSQADSGGYNGSAWTRLGSLWINDVDIPTASPADFNRIADQPFFKGFVGSTSTSAHFLPRYLAYFDKNGDPVFYTVNAYAKYPNGATITEYSGHTTVYRAFFDIPTGVAVNVNMDIIGEQYDVLVYDKASNAELPPDVTAQPADDIYRCNVQSAVNNTYRVTYAASIVVPDNYYMNNYGDVLYYAPATMTTSEGGIGMQCGSTGFFDENLSDIEFKWRYSALLVRAFRGEIDPRILSPIRIPAFFLFDAGFNTVCGMNVLPYTEPNVEDVIYASSIFTEDEKDQVMYDKSVIGNIKTYEDIDVKQAMYDLMIERVYQRIPEENRPIGPGSGLSLHLDSGVTDAATAIAINNSFKQRFDNPNASWDIGGYVSADNGVSYTYLRQIIANCFTHYRNYSINKPFVGDYSAINKSQYLSFFPDLDATDWEMRELYYNSGGNAWIQDSQGNITRRSQRSLYREETGTSDLYQESNMRTLSQFCYLIQEEIDHYLLEYNDDGVIKTMQEAVNNKFAGWAGNRVESYDIAFRRDINTDGGDILVCEVNVTFRGLILRVPIIVNVNRRTS